MYLYTAALKEERSQSFSSPGNGKATRNCRTINYSKQLITHTQRVIIADRQLITMVLITPPTDSYFIRMRKNQNCLGLCAADRR